MVLVFTGWAGSTGGPAAVRRTADADRIGRIRAAYREDPRPSFVSYGPSTPAEYDALRRLHGNLPG